MDYVLITEEDFDWMYTLAEDGLNTRSDYKEDGDIFYKDFNFKDELRKLFFIRYGKQGVKQ